MDPVDWCWKWWARLSFDLLYFKIVEDSDMLESGWGTSMSLGIQVNESTLNRYSIGIFYLQLIFEIDNLESGGNPTLRLRREDKWFRLFLYWIAILFNCTDNGIGRKFRRGTHKSIDTTQWLFTIQVYCYYSIKVSITYSINTSSLPFSPESTLCLMSPRFNVICIWMHIK